MFGECFEKKVYKLHALQGYCPHLSLNKKKHLISII